MTHERDPDTEHVVYNDLPDARDFDASPLPGVPVGDLEPDEDEAQRWRP